MFFISLQMKPLKHAFKVTCKSHVYPVIGIQSRKVQIGYMYLLLDTHVIVHWLWDKRVQRTNHDQEFCYRYDYNNNNVADTIK